MQATFWDKRAQTYDENIQKHNGDYDKTIDNVQSLLTASDVVLDFACASGELSLDIAPHVQQIHGIDISEKMIELARQKVHHRQVDNIAFDQIDVFDQKLTPKSFSAIIAFNIFHLVVDAPKIVNRLHDLLEPEGLLISQTPCLGERRWIFRLMINLAQKMGVVPAIYSFTFADLEALIFNGNFNVVETTLWDKKNAVQWIVARKM